MKRIVRIIAAIVALLALTSPSTPVHAQSCSLQWCAMCDYRAGGRDWCDLVYFGAACECNFVGGECSAAGMCEYVEFPSP